MKSQYGLQVDAWGALVMGRASLVAEIEELVISNVEERGVENLTVSKNQVSLDGARQEHVVFERDLSKGGRAAVALRVVQQGDEDMVISWRLFEKNVHKERTWGCAYQALIVGGLIVTLSGAIALAVAVGACILPVGMTALGIGLVWWKVSDQLTTASAVEQFESRVLSQTVDWALMRALQSKKVAKQEFRVLQQASQSGLGRLEATRISDYLE